MATIAFTGGAAPQVVYPTDIVEGELYFTAEGYVAYAATKANIMLFDDPSSSALLIPRDWRAETHLVRRFPFTRAPLGFQVTITNATKSLPVATGADIV